MTKNKVIITISVVIFLALSVFLYNANTNPQTQETYTESTKIGKTVYITNSGTKYHRAGCQYLSKSQIEIDLSDAREQYAACSKCNPPR